MPDPSTPRGRGTKARIVALAAALMYERGVSAVSIDDILMASGTGKGQFYHYFAGKDELVSEVLRRQLDLVLDEQRLFALDSWQGIHAWLEAMVGLQENRRRFRGCPLGSVASQAAEQGEQMRGRAAEAFTRWESPLADGLRTMQTSGLLRTDSDPESLAEGTIALVQGGYVLSAIKRHGRPMRSAVAAAEHYLESFAFPG